jgi:hypothetical protein
MADRDVRDLLDQEVGRVDKWARLGRMILTQDDLMLAF